MRRIFFVAKPPTRTQRGRADHRPRNLGEHTLCSLPAASLQRVDVHGMSVSRTLAAPPAPNFVVRTVSASTVVDIRGGHSGHGALQSCAAPRPSVVRSRPLRPLSPPLVDRHSSLSRSQNHAAFAARQTLCDIRQHGQRPRAVQRRTSFVLVIRTQVQPASLQTWSSPAPGAP